MRNWARSSISLALLVSTAFLSAGCGDDGGGTGTASGGSPATTTPGGGGTGSQQQAPGDANAEFECEHPSPAVLEELNNFIALPAVGNLTTNDVVTVLVGPGNDPNVNYWVLAADKPDHDYNTNYFAYLTNAPGLATPSEALWIRVNAANAWENVQWPNDKIARGQLAQAFAVECLN